MGLIHSFLTKSEELDSEFLFQLLQQTNLIILKLFTYDNEELKNEYYEMRHIFSESLREDNQEYSYLLFYKWL